MNPIEDLGLRWHLIKMEIGGFTVKGTQSADAHAH